jgi:histidinol-phosphate aminotransferase
MKSTTSILAPNQSSLSNTQESPKRILLDKNELSEDVNSWLKLKVLDKLMDAEWNRYPENTLQAIESKVAEYAKLQASQVALGPGSASIIANLLNYFAIQQKHIVIVQPTYALFEVHCRNYQIPFTPWMLKNELEFDFEQTPQLDRNSVLFLTSPNNPVGNTIDLETLENLLQRFPETLIVLDNVYYEFSDTDFSPLLNQYSNLLIIRSFSKAFPVASVRLGYICGSENNLGWIKNLRLNYSLNSFSLAVASEILFDPTFQKESLCRVSDIIRQRELLTARIMAYFETNEIEVFRSQGNFILIKVNSELHQEIQNKLHKCHILVLDASKFPKLNDCIRISIGNSEECDAVMNVLLSVTDLKRKNTQAQNSSLLCASSLN